MEQPLLCSCKAFFFAFHCNTKMLFMDEKMGYNIVDKINERWYQNLILIDLHITSKKYKPTALIHSVSCQSAARFQDLDLNGGRKAQRRLSIIDGMATTWRALSSPFLIYATSFVSAPLPSCQRHFNYVSATAFALAPLHLFPCHIICASGTSLYEGNTLFDSTFRKLHILCISTSFSMTQPRALRLYHYLFVRGSEPLSFWQPNFLCNSANSFTTAALP